MAQLWFTTALLAEGWTDRVRLRITDGRIAAIERDVPPEASDDRHGIGLPGFPNLHSHAFQRAMAGLAETRGPEADSFWTWRETMYSLVARMTPDHVEAVTAMAYMEMLEAGFTAVAEFHYLHFPDPFAQAGRIVAAAAETGIGLCLLPVFYAHGGFQGLPPEPRQQRFVTSRDLYARLVARCRDLAAPLPDAIVGVAPHSLRAVTQAELQDAVALAEGGPVHLHIAEQQREIDEAVAALGQRPVAWLLDRFAVDARWCLVHATHVSPEETARLAASGAVAGLCPITEANLGDGIFPGPAYFAAGGRYGIGTDSNVLIDLAEELRSLEYGQRLATRRRNVAADPRFASTGRALFEGALAGGYQALGRALHGLRPEAPADLVSLHRTHPALAARAGDSLLDGWIFAARGGAIDRVWRRGTEVVANGRHRDRARITARFVNALKELA